GVISQASPGGFDTRRSFTANEPLRTSGGSTSYLPEVEIVSRSLLRSSSIRSTATLLPAIDPGAVRSRSAVPFHGREAGRRGVPCPHPRPPRAPRRGRRPF